MTILEISKDGQMEKAITPIHHTVIVRSNKKFGYVPLNILLETRHSLFVIDWYGEFESLYSCKKEQGYQVYIYDLMKKDSFQRFKNDLESKKGHKKAMFVRGGDIVPDKRVHELLIELRKVSWGEGLHVILDDYGVYQIPEIASMFSLWRGHNIGISLVLQETICINGSWNWNCILNNSHFLLWQGEHSKEEYKWLLKYIKKEIIVDDKQILDEISSLENNMALLISFVERIEKGSNYKFVRMSYMSEILNNYKTFEGYTI